LWEWEFEGADMESVVGRGPVKVEQKLNTKEMRKKSKQERKRSRGEADDTLHSR
jgi:hypothetical protein